MPSSTLDYLSFVRVLDEFWIQFWFVGLFNCRKKKCCFFFFFIVFWSHTFLFFPSYHHPQTLGGTVRLGNSQIPKAKLFKKQKSIFHSYSKMHNNLESVYWEVSLSQLQVPSLLRPISLLVCVSLRCTHHYQDSFCKAAHAPGLRQLFSILLGH